MTTIERHTNRNVPSRSDANFRVPPKLTGQVKLALSLLSQKLEYQYGITPGTHVSDADNAFVGKRLHLLNSVFEKYVDESTDPAELRESRAIEKWLAIEAKNAETNTRLENLPEDYQILPRVRWDTFRAFAQSVICDILGETVPYDALFGSFSGGASTSKSRLESHPALKYVGEADITSAALPWFEMVLMDLPGWSTNVPDLKINEVSGNVLFTVPKTAVIDRCACKEPDLNMFLQKGVGDYIRARLKKWGIDLNDQSRNQSLARKGSDDSSLATVDLSSASDSIAKEVVWQFLPLHWFLLLDDLRSPVTTVKGEEHDNEMFSSMGNGFTFELESLLFYAFTRTVAYFEGIKGVVSIYGDDIICPREIVPQLAWAFKVLGFVINETKSFSDGPFRESCGGQYYAGYDVTPFYLREPLKRLTDVIRLCNQIRRWSATGWESDFSYDPYGAWSRYYLDDELLPLWQELARHIPRRFWGGRDLSSTTQLVSNHLPRMRLVPLTSEEDSGVGGYVQWLNASDGRCRVTEPIETGEMTQTVEFYRQRHCPKRTGIGPLAALWSMEDQARDVSDMRTP